MKEGLKNHPVLWIQGSGCTGCSVSILNSVEPTIAKILLDVISLQFHPTIQAAEGWESAPMQGNRRPESEQPKLCA